MKLDFFLFAETDITKAREKTHTWSQFPNILHITALLIYYIILIIYYINSAIKYLNKISPDSKEPTISNSFLNI
jgi:hypothetical protein